MADLLPRHYSYECTASAQDRPYASRPSRTQQLLNPKLVPKLTSDVPNDLLRKYVSRYSPQSPEPESLIIFRKGVADEQLAQKEAQRAEEREREAGGGYEDGQGRHDGRNRSGSVSSYSSSVSTISTNLSRSPSPRTTSQYRERPRDSHRSAPRPAQAQKTNLRKRPRRSSSSSMSYTSESSYDHGNGAGSAERNTRRRRSSISPGERGRRRSPSRERERRKQRRSRSRSFDRSKIARHRRSLTPDDGPKHKHDKGPGSRDLDSGSRRGPPGGRPAPVRERSLSPFSKRLALTQAMNMGR